MKIIELKDIGKTYSTGKAAVAALQGVSLTVEEGEFLAIMGPSGSGKSTLLHILGFLDRPDSGEYILGGKNITGLTDNQSAILRNHMMGFVFQQFHLLPRISSLENAELPLIYAGKRHMKEKAMERINDVGLAQRALHRPNELSGGEQQRIAIARALVNDPLIIFADEPTGNLDTRSQNEIMSIIAELNSKGKTIIMVTHEEEVAGYARRIIRMRDGKVIADEALHKDGIPLGEIRRSEKKKNIPDEKTANPISVSVDAIISGSRLDIKRAEFTDHFRQAFFSIISHKMRTALSMLGILIGVAAVIAMLALGTGAQESIRKQLASLGSNLLMIRSGSHHLRGVSLGAGAIARFTFQDVDAISKLPGVKCVSPNVSGSGQVVYGNKNWNTQVQGVSVKYATMRAAVPTVGRFFTEEEVRMRARVALVGTTVLRQVFGEENPIDKYIKIERVNFKVIGILPEKGAAGPRDQDDVVIIPVTTGMYRLLGKQYIDSIDVEVSDISLMDEAEKSINELLIKRHRLATAKENQDAFEIRNMADIKQTLESTTKTISMLLGSIAAISLLVGGIGIMNIMLVSVTERTREIGLRKAIGARESDIMLQFLIESVTMTLSGGIAGVLFGTGIAMLLAVVAGWTIKVSLFSILLATTFSIAIGLIFGLWPARQAAKLDPIEALRYE
ncbi:MAG: ABC transporter permease [Candidatus Omnitrophica bacterium]|nr:ABC transporter permease [Candidatus Omnitrophota bacterium]